MKKKLKKELLEKVIDKNQDSSLESKDKLIYTKSSSSFIKMAKKKKKKKKKKKRGEELTDSEIGKNNYIYINFNNDNISNI